MKREIKRVPWGTIPARNSATMIEIGRVTWDDVKSAQAWVRTFQRAALVIDLVSQQPARFIPASLYKRFWDTKNRT